MLDYLSEQIMSLKMARNEIYRKVLKTPYSKWHRSLHSGIAYSDIDKIAQCPGCGKALFIADTIFNPNDSYKTKPFYTKQVYFEISQALKIPYFEIYYTTVGRADDGDLERVSVRLIYPKTGVLRHISLTNWQHYLEHKVLEHGPACRSKKYILKRINEKDKRNETILNKEKYVKILSN